ncbi:hypothetical protein [Sphingomonas sp.]|jgi:hypothetical protein|uniref:hypothetical protein n=1 Tax=Sphingomonas sp. TaxID=28214 RepID=UPI002ED82DCC
MRALLAVAATAATPALAQDIALKPLASARLRYETVEQDGIAAQADALTLRVRTGVQATSGAFAALVEAQGNLAIVGDYYDGVNGIADCPLVADPQNVALFRAQVRYQTRAVAITAGRQRIVLDDERFVGDVAFRQNAQTFDAVRVEWAGLPRLKADVSYIGAVRTIWGIDGKGARPTVIPGDTMLANIAYATPIGTATGFAYLIDQDSAGVQGFRLSSQSYGVRLVGTHAFAPSVRLAYQGSYARQSDYRGNPNRYAADYHLLDATLGVRAFKLGGGYEVLGAGSGAPLTSFQTPLATGFKFQGWANKFLTTPPDGVRDAHASVGYAAPAIGALKAVTFQAIYHRFESDRQVRHYGNEIDLLATAKWRRTNVAVRYADYRADGFAADTTKLWLQLDWTI